MSLVEGWWKKKGKKKLSKAKPRYFILGTEFFDWYTKPGAERTGSIGLDRLYIRVSADKKELIVGDSGNSKEMILTNDQHDVTAKVKEWFDAITLAIDAVREKKKAAMSRANLPTTKDKPNPPSSTSPRDMDKPSADSSSHKPDLSPRVNQDSSYKTPDSSHNPSHSHGHSHTQSHTVTSQDNHQVAHMEAQMQARAEAEQRAQAIAKAQADILAQKQFEQQQINFATQKLNEVSISAQASQNAALQATIAAQEMAAVAAQQQALADAALERARQVSQPQSPYQTQQTPQQNYQQPQQQFQQTITQQPPQQQYQQPQQQFQQTVMQQIYQHMRCHEMVYETQEGHFELIICSLLINKQPFNNPNLNFSKL
jgi:hypothetical protein